MGQNQAVLRHLIILIPTNEWLSTYVLLDLNHCVLVLAYFFIGRPMLHVGAMFKSDTILHEILSLKLGKTRLLNVAHGVGSHASVVLVLC